MEVASRLQDVLWASSAGGWADWWRQKGWVAHALLGKAICSPEARFLSGDERLVRAKAAPKPAQGRESLDLLVALTQKANYLNYG